jgi:hypothetical protein
MASKALKIEGVQRGNDVESSAQGDSSASPAIRINGNNHVVPMESQESSATLIGAAREAELPLSQSASITAGGTDVQADNLQMDDKFWMYLVGIPPHSYEDADLLKAGYHIGDKKLLQHRYSFLRQEISAWPVSKRLLREADDRLTGIEKEGTSRKCLMVSQITLKCYIFIMFNYTA